MKQINKQESLKQWYLKYINDFREKYELLPTEEKKGIINVSNFLNPCQIEVFWIDDLNYQLIVKSNFNDRPDKEIRINGPYKAHEFQSKVIAILKEERWSRKFKENRPQGYEQFDTLGEKIATEIYEFIVESKNNIFKPQKNNADSQMGVDDTVVSIHVGNIGELNHIRESEKIIQMIKHDSKYKQERTTSLHPASLGLKEFDGFGAHLFPPVIIGAEYKRSIEELVHNTFNHWRNNNKVFDTKINNKQIIVNNDGLIFIENKDKKDALKILNLIMAFGVFYKFPLQAVREQELVMANYDKHNLITEDMEWYTKTRRTPLIENHFSLRYDYSIVKTKINLDTIKEILSNTEKLLKYEQLSTDMRLLNDGKTHFANYEFAPAFVMSWSVIERHYSDLWNTLHQKNIDNNCLKKSNSSQQTINSILKDLHSQNKIDKNPYDRLMELKNKRNDFYHNGMQIMKNDAESCIKCATELLDNKINKHITISNNMLCLHSNLNTEYFIKKFY